MLTFLAFKIATDRYPLLKGLFLRELPDLEDFTLTMLHEALMMPAARTVKTLFLGYYGSEDGERPEWDFFSRVLGLYKEDPGNNFLPGLNNLILGGYDSSFWLELCPYLVVGKFPKLAKVRWYDADNFEDNDPFDDDTGFEWHQIDSNITKAYLELLDKRRKIQWFSEKMISPRAVPELFRSLSSLRDPLILNLLERVYLDQNFDHQCCAALAGAISSGNLRTIRDLSFVFDGASCELVDYSNVGAVIHHGFLPQLRSLHSGRTNQGEGAGRPSALKCWSSFLGSIPFGGLSELETLTEPEKAFFKAIASSGHQAIFKNVTSLDIKIYEAEFINKNMSICEALDAGAFPNLKEFTFRGKKPDA